jgi:hypothetical protein
MRGTFAKQKRLLRSSAERARNNPSSASKESAMSEQTQSINRAREHAQEQARRLARFDYRAPAELFPSRGKNGHGRITYKRFDTAAEAIRFSIEDVPPAALLGAYLELDEARFGVEEMRILYRDAVFPLKRRNEQQPSFKLGKRSK